MKTIPLSARRVIQIDGTPRPSGSARSYIVMFCWSGGSFGIRCPYHMAANWPDYQHWIVRVAAFVMGLLIATIISP